MVTTTRPLPLVLLLAIAACGGATDAPPSAPPPAVTPPGGEAPVDASACSRGASDLEVASTDLNGYPPYAANACSLAYVAKDGTLVLRDLATGKEDVVAVASSRPRRPALSREVVAWEADEAGVSVVRVRVRAAGVTYTVEGAFARAGEPRVSGSVVAFTAFAGAADSADSDVWLHDAATKESRLVLGGPAQQRFADVSARAVVATDFTEDPDGVYTGDGRDLGDIIVFDRTSGTVTRRSAPGKQAFPMLGGGDVLAYLEWSLVHPEPKLVAYDLKAGPIAGRPEDDRTVARVTYASAEYARPAVAGDAIEWVANPDGRTTLHRAPLDGSAPPIAVAGLEDLRLFAPAPSNGFTVLATSPRAGGGTASAAPRLRGVVR